MPEAASPPDPVKRLAAILWGDEATLARALERLRSLGPGLDFEGPDRPFDATRYYEPEMGQGLRRRIVSLGSLASPDCLVDLKHAAIEIEDALRGPRGRTVNVDVGYMDIHKVVLASMKHGPQKIYISRGIYADMICRYSRGTFHTFEWTFPDFRDGRYDRELLEVRARYKVDLGRS